MTPVTACSPADRFTQEMAIFGNDLSTLPVAEFPGRNPGSRRYPAAAPASLLALANCRQPQVTARHATLCLSIEGRPEDRAAKPGDTRPVPGEPCLTGVWPGLGLAGVPGRCPAWPGDLVHLTDSTCLASLDARYIGPG